MSKHKILALILLFSLNSYAGVDVIYGKDNRKDYYQVYNSLHKKLAASTAGMVHLGFFERSNKANFFNLKNIDTLERSQNICATEAFSQQPAVANCSGFLVAPDVLVTAGHCYKAMATPEDVCKSFAWVFDLHMKSELSNPSLDIPLENIYLCKEVVAAVLDVNLDYAVIKLQRPVTNRVPLAYRTTGKVSQSQSLLVIGHPSGLPTKITDGGKVTLNVERTKFSTNLDTFHGNSGSAVFDAKTGIIEGILIQGKTDYLPHDLKNPNSCMVVNKCDELAKNCSTGPEEMNPVKWGEVVLRMDQVIPAIQKAINLPSTSVANK